MTFAIDLRKVASDKRDFDLKESGSRQLPAQLVKELNEKAELGHIGHRYDTGYPTMELREAWNFFPRRAKLKEYEHNFADVFVLWKTLESRGFEVQWDYYTNKSTMILVIIWGK